MSDGQLETIKDAKKAAKYPNWEFEYWDKELKEAVKFQEDWEKEADNCLAIYKDKTQGKNGFTQKRYNVLYSNISTLEPLVFSRLPNPEIRRRNLEKDVIARIVSTMLERAIKCTLEKTEADQKIKKAVKDYLIAGRGIVRVAFEADTMEIEMERETGEFDDLGNPKMEQYKDEVLENKEIVLEYFAYKDVVYSPAMKWEDVRWVAFRHKLTRDQLVEKFGEKGKKVELTHSVLNHTKNDVKNEIKDVFKRAEVWEIWDKTSKTIYFISDGYKWGLLDEREDNYRLKNFFNIPKPLGIDSGIDSINPIPDYRWYKAQAEELNIISERITKLAEQVKIGGAYNSLLETQNAASILDNDGQWDPLKIPAGENINNYFYNKDITPTVNALVALYGQRQQIIVAIQEITGISDIVRGQTESQETATAQELKGNFAISRIQPKQRAVEFFSRDIIRIMCELFAENYSVEELAAMTGMKIYNMDQIQAFLMQEANQQQIPTEQVGQWFTEQLKPIKNEIKAGNAFTTNQIPQIEKVLKTDKLRDYAIEVETDSTIQIDQNQEKQKTIEFMNAFGSMTGQLVPLLQGGLLSKDAFKGIISYSMRRFDGSEEIEDLLTDDGEDEQKGPSLEEQMAMKEAELKEREVAVKEFNAQSDAAYNQGKLKLDEQKLNVDLELQDSKAHVDSSNYQRDREVALATAILKTRIEQSKLENINQKTAQK